MTLHRVLIATAAACLAAGAALAQEDAPRPVVRRPSLGFRIGYFGSRSFTTHNATESTTKPIADYIYNASTGKSGVRVSPYAEYRLSPRLSLGLEFLFEPVRFAQYTEIRTGKQDPYSATDSRPVTTVKQNTRASYWELPLLARYYGLGNSWLRSRAYAAGGLTYRHVSHIRSGNEYSNADQSTDYNEIAATPNTSNQAGVTAAVGLRFIDEFHIKVSPEVRVTRWLGTTFRTPALRSAANQISAGIGFSF